MEGIDLIALYDVKQTVVSGGDQMVVSKLNYHRQWELIHISEAAAVMEIVVESSRINCQLQSWGS